MITLALQNTINLDDIFKSLANGTRRDIIKRVSKKPMSVSDLAQYYKQTFAGISKHLKVLENARLIIKKRRGKEQIVEIYPKTFASTQDYLKQLESMWQDRFDRLDDLLKKSKTI